MKRYIILLAVIFVFVGRVPAQMVNAQYNFSLLGARTLAVSKVTIQSLPINAVNVIGTNIYSPRYLSFGVSQWPSLTNGSLLVTNLDCGIAYQVIFQDGYGYP